jgi:ribonuclease P/MRP protein subunit POP5
VIKIIKPILPSLREKKRYIVYEAISDKKLNSNEIKQSIDDALLKFIGEFGYAKAGPLFVQTKNNKGIIRINNKYLNEIKTSLALIEKIKNKKVIIKTIGVSGILKKARLKYL